MNFSLWTQRSTSFPISILLSDMLLWLYIFVDLIRNSADFRNSACGTIRRLLSCSWFAFSCDNSSMFDKTSGGRPPADGQRALRSSYQKEICVPWKFHTHHVCQRLCPQLHQRFWRRNEFARFSLRMLVSTRLLELLAFSRSQSTLLSDDGVGLNLEPMLDTWLTLTAGVGSWQQDIYWHVFSILCLFGIIKTSFEQHQLGTLNESTKF